MEFLKLILSQSLVQLIVLPSVVAIPLLFFPRSKEKVARAYTLFAFVVLAIVGLCYLGSVWGGEGAFPEVNEAPIPWIEAWGISWNVGIDGLSMPLVALTLFIMPLVILGSWRGIQKHWKGFGISMLLLTTGMLGALLARDLFLFYVFWELMLIPMYLIIGIWGGDRRIYAAVKFFLFTMAGSLPMLIGIIWMGTSYHDITGIWSFAYADLLSVSFPIFHQKLLFAAFAIAFAIKVPMFPLHTWLPDAHVQAPTGGSVVLAGVLLKLGTYGFLRFALPMFPHAAASSQTLLVVLSVIGIIYGALVAWVQNDMKKLVAYSSVAHLGFVMLGIMAFDIIAWQGAVLQMVNHGLSTGALFLLVGMLYDRRHTKKFADYGGLAKVMPLFAFFLVFSSLASVGLPALNGFVGEFMILVGSYRSTFADLRWAVALGAVGVILAAIYLLKLILEVLWGPITSEENRNLQDLNLREILAVAPLAILMLIIGLMPGPFLEPSRNALETSLTQFHERLTTEPGPVPVLLVDLETRDEKHTEASR